MIYKINDFNKYQEQSHLYECVYDHHTYVGIMIVNLFINQFILFIGIGISFILIDFNRSKEEE